MTMTPTPMQLIYAWDEGSDELRRDVIAFWREHRALPPTADPQERVAQVLIVAKNPEGRIAGVCTAYNAVHPRLEHRLFHFRAFIDPTARNRRLGTDLMIEGKIYLERYNERLPEAEKAIGIIIDVEADVLKVSRDARRPIWPYSGMIFLGRTPQGHHLRVHYFKDAVMNFSGPGPAS
jgi:GNAT superfamily N-acetyltransferase